MRVLSVLLVALTVAGSAYSQCTVNDASSAQLDSTFGPTTGGDALTFNNNLGNQIQIANNYNFVSNGVVQSNGGDNLVLTGTLTPANSSLTDKFSLRAAFVRTTTPSDVKRELQAGAYTSNGGTVDPSTWSFYQILPDNTKMVSLTNPNTVVTMSENPNTALQVGVGANGKNLQNGASGWFQFKATDGSVSIQSGNGEMEVVDININLGCSSTFDCVSNTYTISKASIDKSLTDQQNDQALYVDQVSTVFGNQQRFDTSSGTVNTISIDQTNGNLRLGAGFTSISDSSITVNCDLRFSPALPSANYQPKLELMNSAYVSGGGSIDPNTWAYYTVNVSGSSCTRNDGTVVTITGDQDNMYLQWGKGANGKNGNFGLSVWLNYVDAALTNPFFDINVDTVCETNPSTNLPETSPPTEQPTAPPATCPPGCIPAIPVVNVTETPAAGNSASSIEMSKLVVAILSLFILAFFH
ncbi:hypothetical protein DDB_G0291392 [Dictyostelium discoideum AX4]|uniref:Uncharacterized protein DDB_G0291392 n=1 Tax=Dictyostelium discoideum TaxID=44689 RepID=Y1392_DICDI|nr:hypothetical protein DDB_G0291392 [Dictyostelium discoideum AX4]Q54EQ7.1 RecName: Full=Uncharacterized protein DDB_G0291392; Flags: Precursor [Dictyostelium discoideum]EAL61680.1 hypothetical protein DDB_G0291392 [Dictyostelium discoideum AX4]|eukprot:XP_635183.1 hypothetical protein DDB_G0291392 [Dictyostelium discoideum AX4]